MLCPRCFSQHALCVIRDAGEFDAERIDYWCHLHCVAMYVAEHQRRKALLQRIRGPFKLREQRRFRDMLQRNGLPPILSK